ncbi:hypothetical protein, partial [Escherichia albertii]
MKAAYYCARRTTAASNNPVPDDLYHPAFLCTENPQLGWGFWKAFSFEPVIKTPFDLLKHLAVWQLQVSNKKSKG